MGWRSRARRSSPAGPVGESISIRKSRRQELFGAGVLTICGERVRGWSQAVVPVVAVLICPEFTPEVELLLLLVLVIVETVCARLPNVYHGAWDGLSSRKIRHLTPHLAELSLMRALDNRSANITEWSVGVPEGAEDGGGGWVSIGVADDFVGDFIH